MAGLWHHYWAWTGGNVGAMPLQGIIAVLFAVCFRKPLARWWHKHFGVRADLADLKATADAAHKIMADLYRHHTGTQHPAAPGKDESEVA